MLGSEDRIYAFIWRSGPNGSHGVSILEQDFGPYPDYFRKLTAERTVIAGSPFLDNDGGGLALIRPARIAEAQAVVNADPAIIGGVFAGQVRLLHIVFAEADGLT